MVLNKKKKAAVIIAAVILIAAAVSAVLIIHNHKIKSEIEQYLQKSPDLYGELCIISDAAEVDNNKHSIAGIKEAVRLGADVVTLDICFDTDGTPVVCRDFDDISDSSLSLEEVFKMITEDDEYSSVNLNLRLRQLTSLEALNSLLKKYEIEGRVIISGIDRDRYSLISGDDTSASLFFDYQVKGTAEEAITEIENLQKDYNISGVIIDAKSIDAKLTDTLVQSGIPFIVSGADSDIEIYRVLSLGANLIQTNSPERLKEIYKDWEDIALSQMEKSIADGLKQ